MQTLSPTVTDADLNLLRRRALRRRRPQTGPLVEALEPQIRIAVRTAGRLLLEPAEARSEAVIVLLESVPRWQHLPADQFRAVATTAMRHAIQRADRAARTAWAREVVLPEHEEVADDGAERALGAVEDALAAEAVLRALEPRAALLLACRAWGLAHPERALTLAQLGEILGIGDRGAAARHLRQAQLAAREVLAA